MRIRSPLTFDLTSDSELIRPNLPGRMAGVPHLLEHVLFLEGVHARPETIVAIAVQLVVACEPFDRFPLEDRLIAIDVVEGPGIQHEESAVDPALALLGLLRERGHPIPFEADTAEAGGRFHRGD